jgi:hypothetical protein
MSNLLNLNKARKARDRAARKAKAAENSVRFGQSKPEKDAQKARQALADRQLDNTRRGS